MLPALALLIAWSLSEQSRCGPNALLPYAIFITMAGIALLLAGVFIKQPQFNGHQISSIIGGLVLVGLAVALFLLPCRDVLDGIFAVFVASILFLGVGEGVVVNVIGSRYDLRKTASILNSYEKQGRPIAHSGKYHGQFHFLGRLKRPFQVISDSQIDSWLREHPGGRVVAYSRRPSRSSTWELIHTQRYRGSTLKILGAPSN